MPPSNGLWTFETMSALLPNERETRVRPKLQSKQDIYVYTYICMYRKYVTKQLRMKCFSPQEQPFSVSKTQDMSGARPRPRPPRPSPR